MGVADFDAQKHDLSYGWSTSGAAYEFVPSTAINRYFKVIENDGLTGAVSRIDRGGTISGLAGKVKGPRGAIAPQGEFEIPLRLGKAELGLMTALSGFAQTGVQYGADTAYSHVIDPGQTDIDVEDRRLWFRQDLRDGEPKLMGPSVIQAINFQFNKGEVAKMTVAPLSLGWQYYWTPSVVAGTATLPIQIVGWLSATNRALADKLLSIQVTAYSSPTLTCKAEFAAAPGYTGTVTFQLTEGLDAEGRPIFTEVLDSESAAPGLPIGTADNPLYAFAPLATGIAVSDEYSYINPIASPTRVVPTEPEISVAAICAKVDDVLIADLESVNMNIVQTWQLVEGGACGVFPGAFKRQGNLLVNGTIARNWTTYRHEGQLRDDASFDLQITGRSDTQIDTGGARTDQYKFTLEAPGAYFADGATFKSFAGGSTDDGLEIPFEAEPNSGIGNAPFRITADNAVADNLA